MTLFRKKNSTFSRPKFLMTFFSHRPWFSDFFYRFPEFHIFAACRPNVVFGPVFTRKNPISENNSLMTPFFTLFMLSHASDKHYFSKCWEDGCMGRLPTSNFGGDRLPSPPSSPPVGASLDRWGRGQRRPQSRSTEEAMGGYDTPRHEVSPIKKEHRAYWWPKEVES